MPTDTSRQYDVLLLDFGGVCLLNPVEMHRFAEQQLGLAPMTLTWMGPLDLTTDPLWAAMVAGEGVTERQYWHQRAAEIGQAAGREMTLHDYMEVLFVPPHDAMMRPEATDVVARAFAHGYGVSVLTNDLRAFHGKEWERGVPLLQRVDHVVDCSDTGILKPDPRAYERALEFIGVPAERVLFVDDQPLNAQGATNVGMHGFWFDVANATKSWSDVADLLGL
jgi:putative hydrolase of the HAD superfamily